MRPALPLRALVPALLLAGCAGNYVARTAGVRSAYEAGDYERALKGLETAKGGEVDRLLYLLDRGMVLHAAGRWDESNAALAQAEQLAAQLEIVSVSEEARVLLANERQKAYRGEDFEKLLVNVLKALNFAALGREEEALVEVRRCNERLTRMVREDKKPYEQLAIARYLGGVLYENQREWDSAYIDYRMALELAPGLGELAEPLVRLAGQTGREDELAALRTEHPSLAASPLAKDEGQLVVVIERGLAPEKVASELWLGAKWVAVPSYQPRYWPNEPAEVRAEGLIAQTHLVTSVEDVAQKHLKDRLGRMLFKNVAGTAVKGGVAAGIGAATKSEEVGKLAFLLMSFGNEADLRSWLSLPAQFQIARLRLPAGKQLVEVDVGRLVTQHEVEILPGRVRLLVLRRYR